MKFISFCLTEKQIVFGLPSVFFLVWYSCEQQESSLVPIINALADGLSVQDCSVAICRRNYQKPTVSPYSKLSSLIKQPHNKGTWCGNKLNSFHSLERNQTLHTEFVGGLRDTHTVLQGCALFSLALKQRTAGSELTVWISMSLDGSQIHEQANLGGNWRE